MIVFVFSLDRVIAKPVKKGPYWFYTKLEKNALSENLSNMIYNHVIVKNTYSLYARGL